MTAPRRHVYEADVVRVLTFACVIAVHTISHTESNSNVSANGVEMLLHFTREAFFALTGFVLLLQTIGRPLVVTKFWRRRLVAVAVPYAAWTVIYTAIQSTAGFGTVGYELHHLGTNLMYGQAWYHMYFLLVSMQIYVLFPLISLLVKKTAGHHGALLAVSAVLQLALLSFQMYAPPRGGWLAQVATHQDALITSYQFYVLLGAVAACHLDRIQAVFAARSRQIIAAVVALAVVTEVWYLLDERTGRLAVNAAAVLQPVMLPWSIAAVAGLFLVGGVYSRRRRAGSRTDRALTVASDRSFGVFLVHPAVLWFLLQGQVRWVPGLHGWALTVSAYVVVVAGSLALTEIFRRTPLSLPLTGRASLPHVGHVVEEKGPGKQGKEDSHVRNRIDTPGAPVQAPFEGDNDGDRQRIADPLLH